MNKTSTICMMAVAACWSSLAASIPVKSFQIKFNDEAAADSVLASRPDLSFERIIPEASDSAIEKPHRDAGLHLWYKAELKDESQVTHEVGKFLTKKGVLFAKPTVYIELPEYKAASADGMAGAEARSASALSMTDGAAVNDPLYNMQWHYANKECANINLERAWELEQGKRNVVVAVMDGRIDYTHPDIAPNLWVNEAELNGTPGVDDDGNGYIDDIYGLNQAGEEGFNDHGTHIAGTIAAVNNNGVGVCGIAGGNGRDTGVKVMSVAINRGTNNFVPDYRLSQAFVYAADNGAVISSNSWRGEDIPSKIICEGINYFMDNAGQFDGSPLNGGLVVFAAGNDNSNVSPGPINSQTLRRENLITVAAVGNTGKRSSFSNYGPWVDVAAPGGEFDGKGIYSTFTGGRYGYMNGTSMACPHVAGVAALVVSKFGGPSLTPAEVKRIILNSASPVDELQAGYKKGAGQVGSGIVDAYMALQDNPGVPPSLPADFTVTRDRSGCTQFSWTMPADGNGNSPAQTAIYAEDSRVPVITFNTSGYDVGEAYSYFAEAIDVSDSGEYCLESIDLWGNRSGKSEVVPVADWRDKCVIYNPYNTTHFNVYRPSENGYVRGYEDVKLTFQYQSEYYDNFFPMVEDPLDIVSFIRSVSDVELTFNVTRSTPLGTYPLKIWLSNADGVAGGEALELTYTVLDGLENNTGPVAADPDKLHFYSPELSGSMDINVRDYLVDPLGLDFTVTDESYTDDLGDTRYSVNLKDGNLHVEYEFTKEAVDFGNTFIEISVEAVNTYYTASDNRFYIHYDPDASVDGIVSDASDAGCSGIYTLTGLKVDTPEEELPAGFYIINGKKTIIKK